MRRRKFVKVRLTGAQRQTLIGPPTPFDPSKVPPGSTAELAAACAQLIADGPLTVVVHDPANRNEAFLSAPIGTGPFKFVAYQKDAVIRYATDAGPLRAPEPGRVRVID